MVSNVQDHIGSLNWGYKVQLRDKGVTYKNEFAKFMDAHTVETEDKRGRKKTYTSRRFVIACGGRPTYDDHIDPSLYITSDDLFSLEKPPGKTLVVGASCARPQPAAPRPAESVTSPSPCAQVRRAGMRGIHFAPGNGGARHDAVHPAARLRSADVEHDCGLHGGQGRGR